MIMWIYKQTEPNLWTVGFYDPNGKFYSDSDHNNKDLAADRVHFLNGGKKAVVANELKEHTAFMDQPIFFHGDPGVCHRCGNKGVYTYDPYKAEIDDLYEWNFWCTRCRDEVAEDI